MRKAKENNKRTCTKYEIKRGKLIKEILTFQKNVTMYPTMYHCMNGAWKKKKKVKKT
jgi:hypothetical protein